MQFPGVYQFLWNKWYFDELYSVILVRPALCVIAQLVPGVCDTRVIDPIVDNFGSEQRVKVSQWDGRFEDLEIVDGLVDLTTMSSTPAGPGYSAISNGIPSQLRSVLVLAVIGIYLALSYFLTLGHSRTVKVSSFGRPGCLDFAI